MKELTEIQKLTFIPMLKGHDILVKARGGMKGGKDRKREEKARGSIYNQKKQEKCCKL